jgi:IS1 family transposase
MGAGRFKENTDQYEGYNEVIPAVQHKAVMKKARETNHIEWFNNRMRQCVSRLVVTPSPFQKSSPTISVRPNISYAITT